MNKWSIRNNKNYLLKDLISAKYEVPVVYFDIGGDFDEIANILRKKHPRYFYSSCDLNIGVDFIQAKSIDPGSFDEVCHYLNLVEALINGKLSPEQLINHKEVEASSVLQSALLSASLSELPSFSEINIINAMKPN